MKPINQVSKMKQEIKDELSSIKSITQGDRSFIDDEDQMNQINFQELQMKEFILTRDIQKHINVQQAGEEIINQLINYIVTQVVKISFENDILRKVPYHSAEQAMLIANSLTQLDVGNYDHPQLEAEFGGYEQDNEPEIHKIDPWIRARIQVENKVVIQNEKIPSEQHHHSNSISQVTTAVKFFKSGLKQSLLEKEPKKDQKPAPIDMNEPLNISITEEEMRQQKERQQKEKQDLILAEQRRRQRELKEEQLKYEMMSKDKKSKQFTYDFDGKLIPVTNIKTHKLPPSSYNINSNFVDDQIKNQQSQKGLKKKEKQIASTPNMVVSKKKTPEEEKEFVKYLATSPPILDQLALATGVSLKFEGKQREGPRPQTVELTHLTTNNPTLRMPRKDYFDIIKEGNLNRSSQTGNFNPEQKLSSEGPRDFNNYGLTNLSSQQMLDKMKRQHNLNKIQQKPQKQGGIKVNSTKIFDTLTNTIEEIEEIEQKPKTKTSTQKASSSIQPKRSPVDEFNIAIQKNLNWGRDNLTSTMQSGIKEGLLKHHPRERDISTSLGLTQKKPRDRAILSKLEDGESPPHEARIQTGNQLNRFKKQS